MSLAAAFMVDRRGETVQRMAYKKGIAIVMRDNKGVDELFCGLIS